MQFCLSVRDTLETVPCKIAGTLLLSRAGNDLKSYYLSEFND